jgi:lytic murein transglycosylase
MMHLKLDLKRCSAATVFAAMTVACAATPQPAPEFGVPVADSQTEIVPGDPVGSADAAPVSGLTGSFVSTGNPEMDEWRKDFAARARYEGHSPALVYALLKDISPLDIYLGEDDRSEIANQAEFSKSIWDYLSTAVTDVRFETGRQKLAEMNEVFDKIEQTYGVNREVVSAIWAMETNFGSYIGNYEAANTLANMAVEGRRRGFAESQLLALMKIVENGYARVDQLGSGWAGAMGHTQFMPTTYISYAQDYDGDGLANVWTSAPDALASAANYLSASGYRFEEPWGVEVLAPTGFDWSMADGNDRRLSTWKSAGLSPIRGGNFGIVDSDYAELWLPAGATGPKYLLFRNFDVFKTYNRSNSYALAVGLLADGLSGKYGPVATWPRDIQRLTITEVKQLQQALNELGYSAGVVDGIAGPGTKGALRNFQTQNGMLADGYPSRPALDRVLARLRS